MKNHKIAGCTLLSAAVVFALAAPSFGMGADSATSVTLQAAVEKDEDAAPSTYFSAQKETPDSLKPRKIKYGPVKKVATSASSLINFVFDLRGFDWSKEGANAILQEKLKPNSDAAREFLKHKEEDEHELSVVAATLQLASVEGKDAVKTKEAIDNLTKLTGAEEAARLHSMLSSTSVVPSQSAFASAVEDKASVDVAQKCIRLKTVLEAAADSDPVVELMTKRLHKYNHRSKFLEVTAKAIYATMGVAAFTPTLAAPIAETTLLTFMMVTGGPEQDKLLKEVYLSKCLQSRANLLNEKAHLAVDCYDMAVLTKNDRLLACSKDLIKQMTNEKAMVAFLGSAPAATTIAPTTVIAPTSAITPPAVSQTADASTYTH